MTYVSVHITHAQLFVLPEFFVVCPLPEADCWADASEQFIVEGDHSVGCTLNLPLSHLKTKEDDLGRKKSVKKID